VSTPSSDHTAAAPVLPVLVFDFDGTVCVGDDPVRAYAEAVLDEAGLDAVTAAEIRDRLDVFLAGKAPEAAYIDGYAAVAALTAEHATAAQQAAAYQLARRALADGDIPVAAPEGLPELLAGLAGRAERVLVTNAPAVGIDETLAAIGLGDSFDLIVTDARKPAGWAHLLPGLTSAAGRPAARLLSIGDIWLNDLSAPLAAGATVFLIDRFGTANSAAPSHATAPTIEALYPAITAWVADPEGFRAANAPQLAASA
jgi:phosphoglycolate phosphatase-like HAD superfamily hydrolase